MSATTSANTASATTCGRTARSTFAAVTVVVWNAIASPGAIFSIAARKAGMSAAPCRRRTISPQ